MNKNEVEELGSILNIKHSGDFVKGVLLLILATSGNFIGNTFNCKQQEVLKKSFFVKHIVILLIIYFSLNFVSDGKTNPLIKVAQTVVIWILFLFFTKLSIKMKGVVILLLGLSYFIYTWIDYGHKTNQSKKTMDLMLIGFDISNYLIAIILIVNFALFVLRDRNIRHIFKPHHMFKDKCVL